MKTEYDNVRFERCTCHESCRIWYAYATGTNERLGRICGDKFSDEGAESMTGECIRDIASFLDELNKK